MGGKVRLVVAIVLLIAAWFWWKWPDNEERAEQAENACWTEDPWKRVENDCPTMTKAQHCQLQKELLSAGRTVIYYDPDC